MPDVEFNLEENFTQMLFLIMWIIKRYIAETPASGQVKMRHRNGDQD